MLLLIKRVLLCAAIGSLMIQAGLSQPSPTTTTSTVSTFSSSSMSSLVGNMSTPASVVGKVSIVMGPQNQTVEALSSVLFQFQPSGPYNGRVIWRKAKTGSLIGVRVVDSQATPPNDPGFPLPNYQLVSPYGLNIMAATWKDGGTYSAILSDAGGIDTTATLVVIDNITATVYPPLTANATTSNTTVNLTCTVFYGGPNPRTFTSIQEQNDRMPQLSMLLGTTDLTNASTVQFVQGDAGLVESVLTRTIVYTITPYQVQNNINLVCTVTTANPVYSQSQFLPIRATRELPDDPSKRFSIEPKKDEYDIDDQITCSLPAYPNAHASWQPSNSPGYQWVESAGEDVLIVDKDMPPGEHTWECVAIDSYNDTIDSYLFTFNVSGHHSGWWYDEEAERQKRIGLGVGLGLGLFFLLLLIILIIYCCVVRKRRDKRPPTVSKQPPPTSADGYRPLDSNPGADYAPSQVPPPIYQPKAAAVPLTGRGAGSPAPSDVNAVPLLERSGHGDLGGSAQFRPQSPAARSSSTVASSVRPNGGAPDAGSNAGFADLGVVAGPPSANRSMLSHNTSVISSGASSIIDPAMQQSSRPLSNRTYMAGGPRDSGRDQLIPPASGHSTGV